MERRGAVYILDLWGDGVREGDRYVGYWASAPEGPSEVLEQGPGWGDADDALTWGRERSDRVLVRVGGQIYTAGNEDYRPTENVRPWEAG